MAETDEYLTVPEVTKLLKLKDDRTVYDKIQAGELPAIRVGHGPRAPIRVRGSDLEKLLRPVVPKHLSDSSEPDEGGDSA